MDTFSKGPHVAAATKRAPVAASQRRGHLSPRQRREHLCGRRSDGGTFADGGDVGTFFPPRRKRVHVGLSAAAEKRCPRRAHAPKGVPVKLALDVDTFFAGSMGLPLRHRADVDTF